MNNKNIKLAFTALTLLLLSQTMFATTINSKDSSNIKTTERITIDAQKFTTIWLKLHINNGAMHEDQKHLQKYLENALDASKNEACSHD